MTRRRVSASNRPRQAGYLHANVSPVHTHPCRYWRTGKSHGPCTCSANDQWDALGFGDDPPQGWAGIVAAAILATEGAVLDDPAVTAARQVTGSYR